MAQQRAQFSRADAISSLSTTASTFVAFAAPNAQHQPNKFKAPAHKHAHHLHSIPPREKSTRTLIIDHMLWVHARTRFAQARAELGMTDRTGGPSSSNYTHRNRPENYEEEDDATSEDERLKTQDLSLARTLRLRADALERVVTSMLDQPPPIHPKYEEDTFSPPASPKLNRAGPSNSLPAPHLHTLPNGVRLRLALGTMINDLFARRPPHSPPISPPDCKFLPPSLTGIAPISACTRNSQNTTRTRSHTPDARALTLYAAGAVSTDAKSQSSVRCPRHLHTGCEICVLAKSGVRPGLSPRISTRDPAWKGISGSPPGGGITGWQDGNGVGSGLARASVGHNVLRREDPFSLNGGGGRISEFLPRFLRLSALVAAELGREVKEEEESRTGVEPASSSDTSAASSSPRRGQTTQGTFSNALRPSREWYMLLTGLLTRAALEGYLTGGWRGPEAAECLMTFGLGLHEPTHTQTTKQDKLVEDFVEFDPDELLSVYDSARVLFPGLRGVVSSSVAQEEFELELDERLRKFYEIPTTTPDLATHMEDLAWQYPAEPVERAAVRFCEAIAKWRGKPELETYKRRSSMVPQDPPGLVPNNTNTINVPMAIQSLVHDPGHIGHGMPSQDFSVLRPSAAKPSVAVYFILPAQASTKPMTWPPKRHRPPDDPLNGLGYGAKQARI